MRGRKLISLDNSRPISYFSVKRTLICACWQKFFCQHFLKRGIVERMEQTEEKSGVQNGQGNVQRMVEVGAEAKAHHYDASKYERPSVTVDVVMMSLRQHDLQVLLVKRRSWPFEGMWAIPGGFVNMDESLGGCGETRTARGDRRARCLS